MSSIVPQHADMNREAWNDLKELHQDVVVDIAVGIDTCLGRQRPVFEDTDADGIDDPVDLSRPDGERWHALSRHTLVTGRTAVTDLAAGWSDPYYRFDVISDYGAFRDLQRHRMLTIDGSYFRPTRVYHA